MTPASFIPARDTQWASSLPPSPTRTGSRATTPLTPSTPGMSAKNGQVYVANYYDAESGAFQTLATANPVGTNYIESEDGYIRLAGVDAYHFGGATHAEADLVTYAYDYTFTYGNGDSYLGKVYAAPENGYGEGYTRTVTDENGLTGAYAITGLAPGFDVGLAGQVFVNSYYDAESGAFQTLATANPVGTDYLGSEDGYIRLAGVDAYHFGGATHAEADLVTYAFAFTLTYSNTDRYQGIVYAEPEHYLGTAPWTVAAENGLTATYAIGSHSVSAAGQPGQVVVASYYDSEMNRTYVPTYSGGSNYLGSEYGFIVTNRPPGDSLVGLPEGIERKFFGYNQYYSYLYEADVKKDH